VQQGAQVVVAIFRPDRMNGPGSLGRGVNEGRPLVGEGVQGIADGRTGAADSQGDRRGPEPLLAGQEDLAAARGAGLGGAKALPQSGSLAFGERSDK
jgi:hypothetical protein